MVPVVVEALATATGGAAAAGTGTWLAWATGCSETLAVVACVAGAAVGPAFVEATVVICGATVGPGFVTAIVV
jgi:hypothetical protein